MPCSQIFEEFRDGKQTLGVLGTLGVAQLRKWSNRQPLLDAVIVAQAVSFTIVS